MGYICGKKEYQVINKGTVSKKSLPILISTLQFNGQQEPGPLLQ